MPVHLLLVLVLLLLLLAGALAAPAAAESGGYATGLAAWRAADGGFGAWELAGTALAADGTLRLDPQTAAAGNDPYPAGSYHGRSFYNGGAFIAGEATSPVVEAGFGFFEAIPSWNADTPPGTWIEVQLRARVGERWTRWYNLGVWAADASTIQRHSVSGQADADGSVATDTLVLSGSQPGATALQLRLRLFSEAPDVSPGVRSAAVAFSMPKGQARRPEPTHPRLWDRILDVPACSQMVYRDGGSVWCSPTSVSMVLGYWQGGDSACEPRVRAAVAGVYDWVYKGHGNWPFNTAYAATQGMEAYVARFSRLTEVEEWVATGVPVIASLSWGIGGLAGAPAPASDGHLVVVVGFDAHGNPVVNDPAGPRNDGVQRTYNRAQFEGRWLEGSGGTVYLIYPPDRPVPQLVHGTQPAAEPQGRALEAATPRPPVRLRVPLLPLYLR
jgi:hypothetical protein